MKKPLLPQGVGCCWLKLAMPGESEQAAGHDEQRATEFWRIAERNTEVQNIRDREYGPRQRPLNIHGSWLQPGHVEHMKVIYVSQSSWLIEL